MNKMLKNLSKVLSVFVGLTIINVWLFRSNRSTSYRGGDATNLIEEFAVYGLEDYFLIIGIIKVSLAIILILSLYYNKLRLFASLGIAIMMLVAINMHMSVVDELIKLTPAATMLISSLLIVYSTKNSK